jgi:acyl-CoA thioester hydrolase
VSATDTRPVHRWPIRVYFEDTDAGGMAYHASYLRWAERARTEALRAIDMPHQRMMDEHDALLVVRRAELEYFRPARLDDPLVVETRTHAMRGVTLVLDQRFLLGGEAAEGLPEAARLLATARIGLACVDTRSLRPKRIPEPWRTALGTAAPTAGAGE